MNWSWHATRWDVVDAQPHATQPCHCLSALLALHDRHQRRVVDGLLHDRRWLQQWLDRRLDGDRLRLRCDLDRTLTGRPDVAELAADRLDMIVKQTHHDLTSWECL